MTTKPQTDKRKGRGLSRVDALALAEALANLTGYSVAECLKEIHAATKETKGAA